MPRTPRPPAGWERYTDGSARNLYGVSGFTAVIEPHRRRLRWSLTLYGNVVSEGIGREPDDVERIVDGIVAKRLARRRMHLDVYANAMGRAL